jgi:3'-phosphoadenosine 5'-phosphosulfate sulfotransferase (PAPS reductase)/FAD synthetase
MDIVISVSYGNDSIAMMQWAHERQALSAAHVAVVYCDTGWAAPEWEDRISQGEAMANKLGFEPLRLKSMGMEALVRMKKGFPGNGQQFCTLWLKGLPFLEWLEQNDQTRKAMVLIGKRRAESEARKDTPEFIDSSEYHGGRKIWHPLFAHSNEERNALIERAGFEVLPHRSNECSPCVNANRGNFRDLSEQQARKVEQLEAEVGQTMFRPDRFNARGIREVIKWAKYSPGQYKPGQDDLFTDGCGSPFGCEV